MKGSIIIVALLTAFSFAAVSAAAQSSQQKAIAPQAPVKPAILPTTNVVTVAPKVHAQLPVAKPIATTPTKATPIAQMKTASAVVVPTQVSETPAGAPKQAVDPAVKPALPVNKN